MHDDTLEHRRAGISNRLIVRIMQDDDAENPWKACDGSWTLYVFERYFDGIGELRDVDSFLYAETYHATVPNIGFLRKQSVGLAWPVSLVDYGSSGIQVRVINDRLDTPDTRYNRINGVIVWENAPGDMGAKSVDDRLKDARACVEELNAWLSGQVYGFSVDTATGEFLDSCWGYYGPDPGYMFDEIRAIVGDYMNRHGFKSAEIGEGTEPDTLYITIGGDCKELADDYNVIPAKVRQAA